MEGLHVPIVSQFLLSLRNMSILGPACLNLWMNQKMDDENHKELAVAEKRQNPSSLRFTALSAKKELEAEVFNDEGNESDEEE